MVQKFLLVVAILPHYSLSTVTGCVHDSLRPHGERYELYYRCIYGTWYELACPSGLRFHADISKCGTCYEGDLYPNEADCSKFLHCSGGNIFSKSCPANLHFNPVEKVCDWPEKAKCKPRIEECTDGDLLPYSGACNKFLLCAEGDLHLISCPLIHHFDKTKKVCVPGICLDLNVEWSLI